MKGSSSSFPNRGTIEIDRPCKQVEEKKVQLSERKENLRRNLVIKHPVSLGHYKKTKMYK